MGCRKLDIRSQFHFTGAEKKPHSCEDGPFAANDAIAYSYDAAGRLGSLSSPSASGDITTDYTYDSMGRVSSLAASSANFAYSYLNASNQIASMTRNSNEVVANTYDPLGRLTSMLYGACPLYKKIEGAGPDSSLMEFHEDGIALERYRPCYLRFYPFGKNLQSESASYVVCAPSKGAQAPSA